MTSIPTHSRSRSSTGRICGDRCEPTTGRTEQRRLSGMRRKTRVNLRARNAPCISLTAYVIYNDMERDLPDPASPLDPPQDQPGKTAPMPEYIAALLYAAGILIGY